MSTQIKTIKTIIVCLFTLLSLHVYASDDVDWVAKVLADNKVTCEEMEELPELVFISGSLDLGSGFGSPIDVDYNCPKSLNQLKFLQQIIEQASNIRAPTTLPNWCTGSMIHAQWRYYHLALAQLGYFPQSYNSSRVGRPDMEYFKEWSYLSVYNRGIYNAYIAELEKAKPLLTDWYINIHSVERKVALQYADNALNSISSYGFGSARESEEIIVPYTEEAIKGTYDSFMSSINSASYTQKFNTLRRLLLHQAPTKIIQKLVSSIQKIPLKNRSESIISSAIYNPNNIQILLDAGYSADHQNNFGKTALYYAIQFNQHGSVKVLLTNGSNINHTYQQETEDDCSGVTQWGRTPLMHAAQHSDTEMINLLLARGANPYARDINGLNAFDYAKNNNKKENENLLFFSEEPENITFTIVMTDQFKKAVVTELVEKVIKKNDLITVNPKQAFSHIYIMASQDITDGVNTSGWTFAVAHISNSIPVKLLNQMEVKGLLSDEPILMLVAQMIQEQGFLKHLNIAHSSNFDPKSIEQIINSFINDFALRARGYNGS